MSKTFDISTFENEVTQLSERRLPAAIVGRKLDATKQVSLAGTLAGIMTPVAKFPLFVQTEHQGNKNVEKLEDFFCTCRLVDEEWRSIAPVGSRYTVVQDTDHFAIMDDLRNISGAELTYGGQVGNNGAKVYMQAALPGDFHIGDDTINLYLTGWNSHDGSGTAKLCVTPIRAVCQNTLMLSIKQAISSFAIRHTISANDREQDARNILNQTFVFFEAMKDEAERLLQTAFSDKQYRQLVGMMTDVPKSSSELQVKRAEQQRQELEELWRAPAQEPIRGTAWAAYNAVVEWIDWYSPARGEDPEAARAMRVMNGTADRAKLLAQKRILVLAK